jgi:hypothetical protein
MPTRSKPLNHERAAVTRKPIPRRVTPWLAEVRGVAKYLSELTAYRPGEGETWVLRQREYYRDRLRDLLDRRPVELVESGVFVYTYIDGQQYPVH